MMNTGIVVVRDASLKRFIEESNRIEGILEPPIAQEITAHIAFLACPKITEAELSAFVAAIGGGPLRVNGRMNVRVGGHIPPRGGSQVVEALEEILAMVDAERDPWTVHVRYETLHPFMDGNGRSGRALWAWQILHQDYYPHTLDMGFLHPAYYAALRASR